MSIVCLHDTELLTHLLEDKNNGFRLLGIFMYELDTTNDELLVVVQKELQKKIYRYIQSNQEVLPKFSEIFYDAFMYQNEIYDYYGKPTKETQNHILRLHSYPDNYFPKRIKGKSMITHKTPYIFTKIEGDELTEVQVGPIHAGIIPPGHFRFTVDGENIINLDNQMGWKHKGVEAYFAKEKNVDTLLEAIQEIAGDSSVAYAITFSKIIESSSGIVIDDTVKLQRIMLLELERIYNHLWTMGALGNDVGQAFILNGFLAVREKFMELYNEIWKSRTLKNTIKIGGIKKILSSSELKKIATLLNKVKIRVSGLIDLATKGEGNYDRFKDTGIITKETIIQHGGLGVAAKSSGVPRDLRQYDIDYKYFDIHFNVVLGEQGDVLDRFFVRAKEYMNSVDIVLQCIKKLSLLPSYSNMKSLEIQLQDGLYVETTEGHRGEILLLILVQKGKIIYFKAKDPSFVNWNLIDYSVLNNIIADFPICNKSLDLSYSGFDM